MSAIAAVHNWSAVLPRSCGARSNGSRSGDRCASSMVMRCPPIWTSALAFPITNGVIGRLNLAQYFNVRSCERGIRIAPNSA